MQLNKPLFLLEGGAWTGPFSQSIDNFSRAISDAGYEYYFGHQLLGNPEIEVPDHLDAENRPVIAYGSIQFMKKLKVQHLAYGWNGTDWHEFTAHIPRDYLLNSDYHLTTWGDFKANKAFWFQRIDPELLFIRPNGGKKLFAGTLLARREFGPFIKGYEATTGVVDTTLCVLAPPKMIQMEWRFVVVNREIVAGTVYAMRGGNPPMAEINLDQIKVYSSDGYEFAKKITLLEWQPDVCYTMDVARDSDGNLSVVELNSFCTAGLYGGPTTDMVEALVAQAYRDYSA